jgi:AraC-like DNA-binding protein
LIRSLLAAQLEDLPETRELLARSLQPQIVQYVRAHLREADLSAARIAHHHHHISVRHLYRLLAGSGIVLGDWIRQQRLEGSRRTLADPGDARTITAVAHHWGFIDVTHFGRAFKAAYGMSPREWRTTSRASHWYLGAPDMALPAEDESH